MTPAGLCCPAIAIAACRAGCVGVLDLEYIKDESAALDCFEKMSAFTDTDFGIKIGKKHIARLDIVADHRPDHFRVLILSCMDKSDLSAVRGSAKTCGLDVLVECVTLAQARSAEAAGVDGIIAKGNESGGVVGHETTFILLQQCLRQLSIPVYAQGGIGFHTAAACRVAGAAGVVLDHQLLLTRESTIADTLKNKIKNFDGSETSIVGETILRPYRLCHRLGKRLVADLQKRELDLLKVMDKTISIEGEWDRSVSEYVGWQSSSENIFLLGQDIALAHPFAEKYVTVSGIVQAMHASVVSMLSNADHIHPLNENSNLAISHSTRLPIVQGPMARVSDTPEFLEHIAREGALPFFAVAWMRADKLKQLLTRTNRLLKGRPWGVGLLGFLPPEIYNEQLKVIKSFHPPFAMVAGARPDQIGQLETDGMAVYVHAASPTLLKMYLNHGASRFVFEGRESGGHVGPRNSFLLWEQLIDAFFENVPRERSHHDYHILFAGGIHDDLSAAMISVIARSLTESGVRVGLQLGSAYLFTAEAVQSGAILKDYQERIIASNGTVILELGGGHANRCIDNPFARSFLGKRHTLLAGGRSPAQIRDVLEKLTAGRLRIATKGVARDVDRATHHRKRNEEYRKLNTAERWQEGMYMVGQLAAMKNEVKNISELHRHISEGSQMILADAFRERPASVKPNPTQNPSDIAIVGMACALPGASTPSRFWENILTGVNHIREVPKDRWDSIHYYSQNRHEKDKLYSKWGAFIDPIMFDPVQFAIPPSSIGSIEPLQLIALQVASDALADAGYAVRPFKRRRTSVVFGISGTAELGQLYSFRSTLPTFLGKDAEKIVHHFDGILPEWTEDSFPGILMNVTAGRIANRLDLGGTNYTVDAACASSLAAVHLGVKELESGTSDMVIAGGADTMQNPFTFLCFSKTQALSPSGVSRPLDQSADGIVIGEGVAAVVLKRLADAKRDGDRIYAVIKGTGASSDGRDKSLTAPHSDGQIRALERAYAKADVSPGTLGLVEAHATGTTVGDKTEIGALNTFLIRHQAPTATCAVGSVKSMIGHTKSAAGIAGVVKASLSLYYRTLPPSLNVNNPIAPLDSMASPLYVNTRRRPWLKPIDGRPRRAGVSAFGFGGTNFHVVIEENSDDYPALPRQVSFRNWPCEVFIWRENDLNKLVAGIGMIQDIIRHHPLTPLSDLAFSVNEPFMSSSHDWKEAASSAFHLAIVATSPDDLSQKIKIVLNKINEAAGGRIDEHDIFFRQSTVQERKKIAFLFPGQGSQYVNMMADLPIQFSMVRQTIEQSDAVLRDQLPKPLSAYIYPPPSSDTSLQSRYDNELRRANIAQSAMGTMDLAVFRLLKEFGICPDMVAGHSYGEYVALCAAGVISAGDLILLSEARGRFIMQAMEQTPGAMAAVGADVDIVARHIRHISNLVVANVNAPEQTVVSGAKDAVAEAVEHFNGLGYRAYPIPVSGAFHSPLIAAACDRLSDFMEKVTFSSPRIDVYSNLNAAPYPGDPGKIAKQLVKHMIEGVKFVDQIEAMYENGAGIFIECGPKNVLSGLVRHILGERPHCMVGTDSNGPSVLGQISCMIGMLAAQGVALKLEALYRGRCLKRLDLQKLSRGPDKPVYSTSTLLVSGADATPINRQQAGATKAIHRVIEPMMLPETTVAVNAASDNVLRKAASAQGGHFASGQRVPVVEKRAMETYRRGACEKASSEMGHEAVTVSHFQHIMSQFLETQNKVMKAYFSKHASAVEPVIKAAPATKDICAGDIRPDGLCLNRQSESAALSIGKHVKPRATHETSDAEQHTETPPVQRSIMIAAPLPDLIGHMPKPSNNVYILIEDGCGIANKIADKLKECQLRAVVVAIGDTTNSPVNGHCQARLHSSGDAARLMKMIRAEVGPIGGLIHLSSLDERRVTSHLETDNWRELLQNQVRHLFLLAKEIVRDLDDTAEKNPACFIAATAMGDISGDGSKTADPVFYPGQAGIAGLLKCMAIEWPRLNVKAIDFPLDASPDEIVGPLLGEMATHDNFVEIRYRSGRRLCLRPQAKPLDTKAAPSLSPNNEWVILVTGGARGITFEVALELAKQYQPILVLVGRSPLPPPEEAGDTAGLTDAKSIKAALIDRAQTPGSHFSIAQVEKAYHRLVKEREIRRNLKAIKDTGSQFEYIAADAADPHAFGEVIDQIYRTHHRLDGVIHGAGIIEDKLICDKSLESFERVFDTKVAAGFTLSRKLQFESLKFVVFFTSVAGIFGNRGQSDYAAANEVLNKLAVYLDTRWPARAVAMNWGPWAKKGMVSDELEKQFAQRGITMVPPQVGTRKMIEELCYGPKGDAELIIGGMNWSAGPARDIERPFQLFPLLVSCPGSRQKLSAGKEVTLQFDLHYDLYLRDHMLDGKPVLPAAMAMELLAEFAKLQVPDLSLVEISNFRVLKGIVVENSRREFRLAAEVTADASDRKHVAVRIMNARNSRQIYYATEVKFGHHTGHIERRPFRYSASMHPFPFSIQETYRRWLFHGPMFKGINDIQGSNDEGIRAWVTPSSPDDCLLDAGKGAWLIDPVVIDCIFQLHIIWARQYRDMTSLPSSIKSYKQLRPLSGEKIECQIKIANASTGSSIIQSEIGLFDQAGGLLGIMHGCESTCSQSLNRLSEHKCKELRGMVNVCK